MIICNPLSYNNGTCYTFTWNGRQLLAAVTDGKLFTFKYNDEGIRTSKTVNRVTTNYYLNGSQILAEETSGNITVYIYDASGSPIGMQYHKATDAEDVWEVYWYELSCCYCNDFWYNYYRGKSYRGSCFTIQKEF